MLYVSVQREKIQRQNQNMWKKAFFSEENDKKEHRASITLLLFQLTEFVLWGRQKVWDLEEKELWSFETFSGREWCLTDYNGKLQIILNICWYITIGYNSTQCLYYAGKNFIYGISLYCLFKYCLTEETWSCIYWRTDNLIKLKKADV